MDWLKCSDNNQIEMKDGFICPDIWNINDSLENYFSIMKEFVPIVFC